MTRAPVPIYLRHPWFVVPPVSVAEILRRINRG